VTSLLATSAAGIATDLGRALREAFFMFWETLWPLVLGFGLSGAVQAFVSRRTMVRAFGDHRPAAVMRASAFGMASSSCSYAASAMAKSMFQKGADFITSLVFMFASTNLVVELGLVLIVLMGWQFAAAEFVGGPIMIVLLAAAGGLLLTPSVVRKARDHVAIATDSHSHGQEVDDGPTPGAPLRSRLTSPAQWADAATYTMADLTMVRRELVIGYVIAGLLAVLVPTGAWNALFLHGHGSWTALENAIVGPVIAFLSFVCSIGNVPLAAALWHGGISMGGVVSFLFADLIAAPLVLVYRRYYGWSVTVRLVLVFWAVMAVSGLVVGAIFSGAGLVPTHRSAQVVDPAFHWNATAFLNVAALFVFGALYWLYRNRTSLGGGAGYGRDPVCGMQVRVQEAPAVRSYMEAEFVFCSDRCADLFVAPPDRYAESAQVTTASQV